METHTKIAKRILLVEGKDDLHVIAHLLKRHDLEGVIDIRDNEGIDKTKSAFEVLVRDLELEIKANNDFLGVVVDANSTPAARWQSLTDKLKQLGYSPPISPLKGGTILSSDGLLPTFGIWVMPDNSNQGMLETFLTYLVPDERQNLWQIAQQTVDKLPAKRFIHQNADHTDKAKIHTYLAWQEEPGKPFGIAVSSNYFESHANHAAEFVQWLRNLFAL